MDNYSKTMNGLLFITHQTERYSCLQSVEIALAGGCRRIQLRMKDASPDEVEKTGLLVKTLCEKYGAELYIDDHVEACKNIRATGVHLGKTDMPPREARQLLGDGFIIGGTANTFEDIQRLHSEGVDYIGLGPFRFTTTKKNLSPIIGLSGYRQIMERCKEHRINLPVFAIGGITTEDIPDILGTGISGIALSSTILQAHNPIEETKRIITIVRQNRTVEKSIENNMDNK
jgi:thiamine-phosphate pyrophosphorylase